MKNVASKSHQVNVWVVVDSKQATLRKFALEDSSSNSVSIQIKHPQLRAPVKIMPEEDKGLIVSTAYQECNKPI